MNFSHGKQATRSLERNSIEFRKHYGVSPRVVAVIWNDLCTVNIGDLKLKEKEKNQRGFGALLMVIHFMFVYPRNSHVLASRFGVNDKYASGKHFWTWASRVAALKETVIRFPEEFGDPNGRPFIMTLDCRDHKCWEKKHPRFNLDAAYSSQKHGMHAALKYELGVAIFHNQICWISGPYKATMHDITVFRQGGLKKKVQEDFPGKYIVVDLGYKTSQPDEDMLAYPSSNNPLPLKKFQSLARCREEDVNGRMSKWKVLHNEFEHSVAQHKICYVAVAVMLQYQFNCGDAYLTKL